jgi:hypothetical protein
LAEGNPCGPETSPDACRADADPSWAGQCAIEFAEQCAEGAACRQMTNRAQTWRCSGGDVGAPCAEDADCDAAPRLLCAGPESIPDRLRVCHEAGFAGQGEPCARAEECAEGLLCRRTSCRTAPTCELPAALEENCCAEGECQPALTCLTFEPRPYCWRANDGEAGERCELDRHCGEGLACVWDGSASACAAPGVEADPCQSDAHCREGLRCVALRPGRCSSGELGAPCRVNEDCQGELLCDATDRICESR